MNRASLQINYRGQSKDSASEILPRFQDLSICFTPDAWQLVISFLINLQEKIKQRKDKRGY